MTLRRISLLLVYVVLFSYAIITLVPFAYMIAGAVKTKMDFAESLFLPAGEGWFGVAWDRLTLDNFRRLFLEFDISGAMVNSIFIASVHAVGSTLLSAMAGFGLAKLKFRGQRTILGLVLASLIIPGPLLLAPSFKLLYQLGLLDTYAGLLLPGLVPAFGIFLFRQAILRGVPTEMIEAARLDGAGDIRIFFEVALPLVRPMVGAFLLISFLGGWNNFVGPQIVLQSPELHPLSVALNNLRGAYGVDYTLILAGTMISITPVMALFLLLQKEFISGLTSGAVKG